MSSSSTSEALLTATGVCLDFPVRLYPQHGLRDVFVEAFRHPWKALAGQPDVLPVLREVNLELRQGDRLALIGDNGAGKSTLCRVLCGMLRPDRGSVRASGTVEAVFEVGVGVMPELTGRENAWLLARFLGAGRPLPPVAVEEALEFSELGPFLDAPFKTYSRGMQARLMLSLVSASPSEVLILDEVFDGADVFFREKIAARMRRKIEASRAVVFVSHSLDQVRELCNRAVVMRAGAVAFDGGVEEAIAHYLAGASAPVEHRG